MRLSKRETFLLFMLGLLGSIGLLTAFLILPMMNEITTNKYTLANLESQKAIIDTYVPQSEALQKELDARIKEVSVEMKKIESPFNEAEFDLQIYPLMTKYKMKILDAVFVEPHVVGPVVVASAFTSPMYKIKELVDALNNVKSVQPTGETTTEPQTEMLQSQYSYKVITTYENYVNLLDEISSWKKSIYITESDYDFVKSQASYTFDVYSIEQLKTAS